MRYILDSEGYVCDVSLGADIMCDCGNCVEYTGKIPSGYLNIEDWLIEETPRLNAWKIVEGNLVFDEDRAIELERIFNEQAELNRHVTYGEVTGMLDGLDIEASNQEELGGILPIRSESGKVITLFDSSSYPMERIYIKCAETTENIKLYISNINMLPNDAMSGNKSGITYTVNEDKSIRLLGNSAEGFSLDISGDETNTEPLFILKAGETYYINDVAYYSNNVTLNLYSHDGTDRILFYTGIGGTSVTPEEDIPITHAEITCTGEVDATVRLMVSTGDYAYEKCVRSVVPIDLNQRVAQLDSVIEIEGEVIIVDGDAVNVMDMPCTYFEKTIIYTDKNTTLDIDYKKSSFDYTTKSGRGTLKLRNTADGYGSIRLFTIDGLEAGSVYILETSDNDEQTETYTLDLTDYEGTVDIAIEEGKVWVIEDGLEVGVLDSIFIRTYSPTTYISVLEGSYRMMAEYMIASDFSIYCTKVEKDASIKMLDDKISLEVSRASAVEGRLLSKIDIEAGKIEQIVEGVGTDGEVTAASIMQAINEDGSLVKISADKVDIEGKIFPKISNEDGSSYIEAYSSGGGIKYDSFVHNFLGIVGLTLEDENQYFVVYNQNGTTLMKAQNDIISIGSGSSTHLNLNGTIYINGTKFDGTGGGGGVPADHDHNNLYYTKAEIDTMMGNVEAVLNTLNSGGGVE